MVDPAVEAKLAGKRSETSPKAGGGDKLEGALGGLEEALRHDDEAKEGLEELLRSLVELSQVMSFRYMSAVVYGCRKMSRHCELSHVIFYAALSLVCIHMPFLCLSLPPPSGVLSFFSLPPLSLSPSLSSVSLHPSLSLSLFCLFFLSLLPLPPPLPPSLPASLPLPLPPSPHIHAAPVTSLPLPSGGRSSKRPRPTRARRAC